MRKIYIIFTLFISLFLFSSNVKAATIIDRTLTYEDFSYINKDFLYFRTKAIEYVRDNYQESYYIISYDIDNNIYLLHIFNQTDDSTEFLLDRMGSGYSRFYVSSFCSSYKLVDDVFTNYSNSSNFSNPFYLNSTFYYYHYLDSNFDMYSESNFDFFDKITLRYNDKYLYFSSQMKVPTYYELYQDFEVGSFSDLHEEEKNILLNFYTIIIEKINLLCELFVSNYIYLSIFVIFILIFVIELLRRLL